MSIWNKVLVGLIGVASLALFYVAARTMKTHQYWRELAIKREQQIEQLDRANQALADGAAGQPGIRQLRLDLSKLVIDRGRQWVHCEPKVAVNPNDGTAVITVTISDPDPHGIAPGAVLYGFEEADVSKGGHYLGEFRVAKADEKQKQAVMAPTARLSLREISAWRPPRGPGCFTRPCPATITNLCLAHRWRERALLPAASLPEYVKDGKAAVGDEPPAQVVDGKYLRPLRDYQAFFAAERVERTLLFDAIDAATGDETLLKAALARAKQQNETVQVRTGRGQGRGG